MHLDLREVYMLLGYNLFTIHAIVFIIENDCFIYGKSPF